MQNRNQYEAATGDTTGWSAFLAGALIGGGVALLFAPQSGTELRGRLGDYANRATDDLLDKGQEAWDTVVERGKESYEKGEAVVRDAGRSAREFAKQEAQTRTVGSVRGQSFGQGVRKHAPRGGPTNKGLRVRSAAQKREDDMKSRHIGACIVLVSGIFVFTGGSIQAQVSSGSPSSGSGNLGGSGAGSGESMTSPGSGSSGSMGQGQAGPNMSKPLPGGPGGTPGSSGGGNPTVPGGSGMGSGRGTGSMGTPGGTGSSGGMGSGGGGMGSTGGAGGGGR